ncbi:mCG145584, isoform CRA_b, partial [Mus musculus]
SSCTGLDPGIRLKRCRSSAECHVPTVRPRLMLDMFVVLGKFRPSLHFSSCHPETICLFFVSWRLLPSVASSCQEWIFLKYQEVTNNKQSWADAIGGCFAHADAACRQECLTRQEHLERARENTSCHPCHPCQGCLLRAPDWPAVTTLQQDPSAHVYWESLIAEAKRPRAQNWCCLYRPRRGVSHTRIGYALRLICMFLI